MFKALVCVLYVAVSVAALSTPHIHSRHSRHHDVAARVASPELPVVDIPEAAPSLFKKSLRRRCQSRPASSSATLQATTVPANVGGDPTVNPTDAPHTIHTNPSKTITTKLPHTTHSSGSGNGGNPSGDQPSYMIGEQTGDGTFYGTGLGACGITNQDTDDIAAVSHLLYDTFPGYNFAAGNPNNNPICGRKVTAHYQGKQVTVTLTDRCTGCAITDLDFSPHAFSQLADQSIGRIHGVTWEWD